MNSAESKGAPKVLHIEDDAEDHYLLKVATNKYAKAPLRLVRAKTLAEARAKLDTYNFDLVVTDLKLPDSSVLETLNCINNELTDIPTIVFSGYVDHLDNSSVNKVAKFSYIKKSSDGLHNLIQQTSFLFS